jgi:hypothetical protein
LYFFLQFWVIETLNPDPDSLEKLDLDPCPDPDSMNPDPQHWREGVEYYLAKPLLSLGRLFSKVYSHRFALVLFPSLSIILKMMSALMGT